MKDTSIKIGRNAPCPCGSGKKYKKCCLGKEISAANNNIADLYQKRYRIRLKTAADIEGIKKAGQLTLDTLDFLETKIKAGLTTDYLNSLAHEFIVKNKGIPAPLNYKGFPKSVCISINDEVCHGIPGKRIIEEGDIVNIDITPILNGYFADANKTFFVGNVNPDAQKIVTVAKQCLKAGISVVKPGNTIGDIGWAIEQKARQENCSVVREYVGHGVGFDFHEEPAVFHFGKKGSGVRLTPGMVFTIEPMINLGTRQIYIKSDKWTAVTKDGCLSAQFEQTVLVTKEGVESLTPYVLS